MAAIEGKIAIAFAAILPRIRKLIPVLGSDQPGEVVAAANAIGGSLRGTGCDWHDLAAAISSGRSLDPPHDYQCSQFAFGDLARFCRDADGGRLSDVERRFVLDMAGLGFFRRPSTRQEAWLKAIYSHLVREAA